jgi:hypothetical protein
MLECNVTINPAGVLIGDHRSIVRRGRLVEHPTENLVEDLREYPTKDPNDVTIVDDKTPTGRHLLVMDVMLTCFPRSLRLGHPSTCLI